MQNKQKLSINLKNKYLQDFVFESIENTCIKENNLVLGFEPFEP